MDRLLGEYFSFDFWREYADWAVDVLWLILISHDLKCLEDWKN
jgi:hypothetical protein